MNFQKAWEIFIEWLSPSKIWYTVHIASEQWSIEVRLLQPQLAHEVILGARVVVIHLEVERERELLCVLPLGAYGVCLSCSPQPSMSRAKNWKLTSCHRKRLWLGKSLGDSSCSALGGAASAWPLTSHYWATDSAVLSGRVDGSSSQRGCRMEETQCYIGIYIYGE